VDILVSRTGIIPDVFYLACAAGDTAQMAKWFDATGQLLPQALRERPDFLDVGWPGRAILPDPDDAMAEGLALAAQLGRTKACAWLLDHGADPARAPLYGVTPLHFAAWMGRYDTVHCSSAGARRWMPAIGCTIAHRSGGRTTTDRKIRGFFTYWEPPRETSLASERPLARPRSRPMPRDGHEPADLGKAPSTHFRGLVSQGEVVA
jgi:hypothetical protein